VGGLWGGRTNCTEKSFIIRNNVEGAYKNDEKEGTYSTPEENEKCIQTFSSVLSREGTTSETVRRRDDNIKMGLKRVGVNFWIRFGLGYVEDIRISKKYDQSSGSMKMQ
jgi:hypothetical protein